MHRSHSRHTFRMDHPIPVSEARWWRDWMGKERPQWWTNSMSRGGKNMEKRMHQRKQRQWDQKIIREELENIGD